MFKILWKVNLETKFHGNLNSLLVEVLKNGINSVLKNEFLDHCFFGVSLPYCFTGTYLPDLSLQTDYGIWMLENSKYKILH